MSQYIPLKLKINGFMSFLKNQKANDCRHDRMPSQSSPMD